MRHFLRMTRVFKAWGFYRAELMKEASERGWPVARHMLLEFPSNLRVYREDLRYQFMLGSELLVAPTYSHSWHKTQSVRVFLPSETSWVHVWSNKTYPGQSQLDTTTYLMASPPLPLLAGTDNWVTVTAPIGYPCMLYPTGSSVGEQFVSNLNKTVGLPTDWRDIIFDNSVW